MREQFIKDIWDKRNAWAEASGRFQQQISRARMAQLGLIILGSVCATASATGFPFENSGDGLALANKVLAGVAAVALALVSFVQQRLLSADQVERWPRARSVTEAIKSEVYRFQAGARPYEDTSTDDALKASLQTLLKAVDAHTEAAGDLLPHLQIVSDGRPAPVQMDQQGYIDKRLLEQVKKYYRPKAQQHFKSARRMSNIVLVLSLVSAIVSALMAAGTEIGLGAWVAVLTTVSLAFVTFASLQRFEFLATSFAKQANRLERLSKEWMLGAWADWSEFVTECENVVSAENRAWMAELTSEQDTMDNVTSDAT